LEGQQTDLRARLERAAQPPPLLHANMADLYREKVIQLASGLEFEESRIGAADALRGLIDAIVLTPERGRSRSSCRATWRRCCRLRRRGAAMMECLLRSDVGNERSPDTDDLVQIMLVAGGGFEPPTFGL